MAEATTPGFIGPGFFGKVPARGDFLARRVPATIAAQWETWLQELTVAVRASGQRGWQDAWLTAPLWHFVLGGNLAGPLGAAGVLIASADRVGRLFPFTLIGEAAADARLDAAAWAQRAEALALSALDDGFDPAVFDAALADLGPPPQSSGGNRVSGWFALTLDGDWPEDAQGGPGPDQSEWWTRGSERLSPTRMRCTGLPDAAQARTMILGGEPAGQNAPSSGAR